ncbi:MAG: ABC transporter ATP-binding protein [Propionibacteriaceae bacterium]|jgi:peptide/nickel transport system ATP-binding protein|nr:ABC transporter ATP-binding protein [Propionibacteriaceae bacterium]
MSAGLAIAGLTVRAASAGRPLLEAVDLQLPAGQRLGLLGESGSGKSTLAYAVAGLLPAGLAAAGSIQLDDQELVGADERTWRTVRGAKVALVFQEPATALDPLMRLGRQLAEPLRRHHGLRGEALEQAVRQALAAVALDEVDQIARAFPHQVSGGQRQRVALAMALACDPTLLIADEPTTALDATVQRGVLELIDRLARQRSMSLLFVTHDIAVAAAVSDRLAVLRSGRLVEHGPAAQLVARPRHPYTARLVASARRFQTALDRAGQPMEEVLR